MEDYKKLYEDLLERVEQMANAQPEVTKAAIESQFPELIEREDERIRKAIIEHFACSHSSMYPYKGFTKEQIIAWLEKQGEHNSFSWTEDDEAKVKAMCEEGNLKPSEREWLNNLRYRVTEKNPTDKVEPKFKVGDLVVRELDNTCYQIKKCILNVTNNKYGYDLTSGGYISSQDANFYHLWTIEDAKDGDVLVASDGSIFLFKGTIDCACKHYVALTTDNVVKFNEGLEHYWETSTAVHPATKKQRDQLEKAMADAGYTFDFEKKELKKIEQNPADKYEPMSLDEAIKHCKEKSCGNNACALEHKQLEKWLTELKELKEQKSSWSEEEEEALEVAIIALEDMYSEDSPLDCYAGHHMPFDKAVNQLKSLKERVQPKQKWSEEDRKIIIELIGIFESAVDGGHVSFQYRLIKDYIRVLKSCLPQNTWKPSDEQMDALWKTLKYLHTSNAHGKAIDGLEELLEQLHEQLKKLREEGV